MVDVVLDKKEVAQIWEKLLETHQKDIQPNRALVETILKEEVVFLIFNLEHL
ncbi:hypothetical protein CLU81_0497 [Flavobacterium sp. 9]|uniref:hypothetical protein n=1 Tax=Flavobacterium sp. 9 TaxID=2035198 RepID=UPI000C6AEA0C|nr:hypothetical protein [Flavobacterium sp. 9]PIF30096.1 hypothetical protein CLU81_0497 [Flavobacterium sp. 9]